MTKLETKVVYNQGAATVAGAVIWLHGLGADYNDFVPIVPELKLAVPLKFVFPNAPVRPVTLNNGFKMRAWYDIVELADLQRAVDSRGIIQSVEQVEAIIAQLIAEGIPSERIIIAGFSQGGVISYYTALTSNYRLGGLIALSTYLPDTTLLDRDLISQRLDLPILVCHGTLDQVVAVTNAVSATNYLKSLGLKFEYQQYPMAHSVCAQEIDKISQFLAACFQ